MNILNLVLVSDSLSLRDALIDDYFYWKQEGDEIKFLIFTYSKEDERRWLLDAESYGLNLSTVDIYNGLGDPNKEIDGFVLSYQSIENLYNELVELLIKINAIVLVDNEHELMGSKCLDFFNRMSEDVLRLKKQLDV